MSLVLYLDGCDLWIQKTFRAWGCMREPVQFNNIRWIPHLQLAHNQLLMKHCLLYSSYLQPGSLSFIDSIDSVTCKVSLWIPSCQHAHETCKAQTLNSHGNSSPLAGGWGWGMFQKDKSVGPCLAEGVAILGMEAFLLGATDVTLGTERSSMNGKLSNAMKTRHWLFAVLTLYSIAISTLQCFSDCWSCP